ncbi:amino acid transporter ANT1-like isoform X2 [Oryza brachyantha]|uniref:amino acid transporter ANT1-like isoform X2 n=2 Tax=Oryza brachyantha TaxID=4533 RepID=UPI001ADA31FB|nr:amino acid transporter ANT1-like isoform X2 [Oryza brachyantha]
MEGRKAAGAGAGMVVVVAEEGAAPLLAPAPGVEEEEEGRRRRVRGGGGATSAQTLGNVVVSIVGTGVLGLPYAFRAAGWVAGSLGVAAAGCATLYCMLLLVDCRDKLEEEKSEEACHGHYTYGDLGEKCFGTIGRCLTEILILVSQAGGSVAYLIFIGQNLHSVFSHFMSPAAFIFAILLPVQIALSFIRSLSSLSPFSIFADVCNVLAMAIVIKDDLQLFDHPFANRSAFNGLWSIPFTFGVAVFCFEGFSMTLALESSMAERRKFRWVLSQAVVGIIIVYACFGVCGYLAYGEATKDIITLNLPNSWSSAAVKVGLCIALVFTFPVMMHPIHEIVEARFQSSACFQKLSQKVRSAEWLGLHSSRIIMMGHGSCTLGTILCNQIDLVQQLGKMAQLRKLRIGNVKRMHCEPHCSHLLVQCIFHLHFNPGGFMPIPSSVLTILTSSLNFNH